MKIGLQLYSIRQACEQDFKSALEHAARAGYDGVEFAGYYGYDAKGLKRLLSDCHLAAAGSHISYNLLTEHLEETVDMCEAVGMYSAVVPGVDFSSAKEWAEFGKSMDAFGKEFRKAGIRFGYHNHAHEFQKYDGKYAIDLLLENSDRENVFFEMDTFWAVKGGMRPQDLAAQYAGRFPVLHAKDIDENGEDTEVMDGTIDFLQTVENAGNTEWLVVEQEAFRMDPLESIAVSCGNLKRAFCS